MCQRTLKFVQRMDWTGALDSCDYYSAMDRYPWATEDDLDDGVRVAFPDGTTKIAIEAVRSIAIRTPLGALAAWLLWVPPIKMLGARIYAYAAAHRKSGACRIGAHR